MANILFVFLSPIWRIIIHSIIQWKILGFMYITLNSVSVADMHSQLTHTTTQDLIIRNTSIECIKRVCMFELDIYLDIY